MSVCLFVCLSARMSQKRAQISPNFMYSLPVTVARSYSDACAIRYVPPVSWITSRFHIMEQMGQNPRRRICFAQFTGWRHQWRSLSFPTAYHFVLGLVQTSKHSKFKMHVWTVSRPIKPGTKQQGYWVSLFTKLIWYKSKQYEYNQNNTIADQTKNT